MRDFNQTRHDFVNNAIRLEVINRLITEALEMGEDLKVEYTNDLRFFLSLHQELLEDIVKN